jgi:hypothetical protein
MEFYEVQESNIMKKDKFVYLVYCNTDPIVYGVYQSKQDAVRYAVMLVRHRRDRAKEKGHEFGYYHFMPLLKSYQIKWMNDPDRPYYRDLLVFTTCLKIKDNSPYTDDYCKVQVVRKILN